MGLRTAAASPVSETPVATVSAIAAPAMNGRMVAAAPFAGAVLRVDVLEGQSVRAGQPLALLFSQDALRVGAELAQAQAEMRAAESAARRARTLADEGIIAGARAEEAAARASQARAMASEKSRLLSAAGGGGRSGEYVLRAPIAGRVSQINLQPGAGVEAMAPAVVIDRGGRTWLEARLPAAQAGRVSVGGAVEAEGRRGRVVAVGSAIDARTRSVVLRAELPPEAEVIPGRAVWMTVYAKAPPGAVSVPRAAVVAVNGQDTVFARSAAGYQPVPVRVEGVSRTVAVVTGLRAGAPVAISGVSQLKAAAGR